MESEGSWRSRTHRRGRPEGPWDRQRCHGNFKAAGLLSPAPRRLAWELRVFHFLLQTLAHVMGETKGRGEDGRRFPHETRASEAGVSKGPSQCLLLVPRFAVVTCPGDTLPQQSSEHLGTHPSPGLREDAESLLC